MSGEDGSLAFPTVDGDSEPGAWAEAIASLPSQQPPQRCAPPPVATLDDVIAYLEQRRDNAATVAEAHQHDELGGLAADRRRQLDVQIDELRAGMHQGAASVRARLTQEIH